jgi:hypothetical protein
MVTLARQSLSEPGSLPGDAGLNFWCGWLSYRAGHVAGKGSAIGDDAGLDERLALSVPIVDRAVEVGYASAGLFVDDGAAVLVGHLGCLSQRFAEGTMFASPARRICSSAT